MRVLPASNENLEEAVSIIRNGGVVAHPTETCYGFACDLTNPEAVKKLALLKKRPKGQPISALFASLEEAAVWVEWNEKAEELAQQYLPGPLTIILPLKNRGGKSGAIYRYIESVEDVSGNAKERKGGTLGIRVSSYPIAQKLSELCKVPLSTTSANLHGKPEPYSAEEILEQFRREKLQPDLILDGGSLPPAPPSTVVLVKEGGIDVVRQGGITVQ